MNSLTCDKKEGLFNGLSPDTVVHPAQKSANILGRHVPDGQPAVDLAARLLPPVHGNATVLSVLAVTAVRFRTVGTAPDDTVVRERVCVEAALEHDRTVQVSQDVFSQVGDPKIEKKMKK